MIAFDLDGTVLNHTGKISERTLSVFNQAHEMGIVLMCCTGRSYESSKAVLNQLGLKEKNGYFCGMNGQIILSYKDSCTIHHEMLNCQEVAELCESVRNHQALAIVQKENQMTIVYNAGKKWIADFYLCVCHLLWIYRQNDSYEKPIIQSIDQFSAKCYAKVCFTALPKTLKKIEKKINKTHKCFSCVNVAPFWMECQKKEISKGNALRYVAEKEGISLKDVLVFGDGENDISMLEAAGTGVAMKNAMKQVKKCADDICESCNHDGVAKYIEKLL